MLIAATTPYLNEDSETMNRCSESIMLEPGYEWWPYQGNIADYGSQARLRDLGRQWAQARGATWWLQLDADERLVGPRMLRERLRYWPHRAYPLLRHEEDGNIMVCPWKLVRLPCLLVQGCDHFSWPGEDIVWRLSQDYSYAADYPGSSSHLVHEPSRRKNVVARLGNVEDVERRPPHAVQWQVPV